MKKNIIRIIFLIVSLGLFDSMIVLTNDNIKERFVVTKVLPTIAVISIMLTLLVLLWQRKIKS